MRLRREDNGTKDRRVMTKFPLLLTTYDWTMIGQLPEHSDKKHTSEVLNPQPEKTKERKQRPKVA